MYTERAAICEINLIEIAFQCFSILFFECVCIRARRVFNVVEDRTRGDCESSLCMCVCVDL